MFLKYWECKRKQNVIVEKWKERKKCCRVAKPREKYAITGQPATCFHSALEVDQQNTYKWECMERGQVMNIISSRASTTLYDKHHALRNATGVIG